MKAKSQLDILRNSIQKAALRDLQREHPDYVAAVRTAVARTKDINQAIESAKDIPTDKGFGRWRPLFEGALDVELAKDKLRTALRLLEKNPPNEVLDAYFLNAGAWTDYHMDVGIFWLDALLERVRKLVRRVVRELIRPGNDEWKSVESDLLKIVLRASERVGKVRDPLAHGGGPVEGLSSERIWELGCVLGLPPLEVSPDLLVSTEEYRNRWHEGLRNTSVIVLAAVEQTFEKLNEQLQFDV